MIEDEDFKKFLQSEKTLEAISEAAFIVAGYYLLLRKRGLPDESALVLTNSFQIVLLTRLTGTKAKLDA